MRLPDYKIQFCSFVGTLSLEHHLEHIEGDNVFQKLLGTVLPKIPGCLAALAAFALSIYST